MGVNWVPIGYSPFGKNSIFIPKRIVNADSGEQVPIKEQLLSFTGMQVSAAIIPEDVLSRNKWCFKDNTEQEILAVVEEMLDRLDGRFIADRVTMDTLERFQNFFLPITFTEDQDTGRKKMLSTLNWAEIESG
ncbi:MAG: TIGR04372 family glycosyltransferase [Sulfuritalea sp.]|nr:TIGR04372 family glycosyltransferase [Sulfuritalea sp.]